MEKLHEPQPGDLIWADRSAIGLPYNHCGIYEGAGYVIHFASPQGSEIDPENAVVHRASFEKFKDGCPVRVIDIEGSFPADKTLRCARSCLGMRGYNFATFNCDHFATWCKTGKNHSIQVDAVKSVLREIGGSTGEFVCQVHDIVEMLKAPRLDSVYPKHENEIVDTLDTNRSMSETIPPVPDKTKDIHVDYKIIEDEPVAEDEAGEDNETGRVDESQGNDNPPPPSLPPAKKAWYEKVGEVIKNLTYPISGGLEVLRRSGKIPIIQNIDFLHLGAKVRSVIDNVITNIKVFTGRMTAEQAIEERKNNETALAGKTIAEKQKQPIKETLKQVFGKVGSVIKQVAQKAVLAVVPPPIRTAIIVGAKTVGKAVVNVVKAGWQIVKQGAKNFFGRIKQKLFG